MVDPPDVVWKHVTVPDESDVMRISVEFVVHAGVLESVKSLGKVSASTVPF